ncbi:MAG: hypothetical protein J6386_17410 [Candidatus Synoicihabitans palmerolidicus]|nr:hypothetical protein [Candidatus Synoicihabitans palmerolidicus]
MLGKSPPVNLRNYILVTAAYWGFTLTDGALRMLVLLHFSTLGYMPVTVAFLFLLYAFCGIVTNLMGGWIASRLGLRVTLVAGLALQVAALIMLARLDSGWSEVFSVAWVMASQALSGIAKDLTKRSSKSAIKVLLPANEQGTLCQCVAILTGSKNALKGARFFLEGYLLAVVVVGGLWRLDWLWFGWGLGWRCRGSWVNRNPKSDGVICGRRAGQLMSCAWAGSSCLGRAIFGLSSGCRCFCTVCSVGNLPRSERSWRAG